MRVIVLLAAAWSPWYVTSAMAACSGSSPTRTAASANRTDVADCLAAAAPNDTIVVPAGVATWTSPVVISKDVTVIGAGRTATRISGSGDCFVLDLSKKTRVSGFGFTNCTISSTGLPGAGKTFRIDNNSFTSATWQIISLDGSCQTPMRHPTGLIDNNSFHNYAVHIDGTNCLMTEGSFQNQLWSQTPPMGSGNDIVYLEDNDISSDPSVHQNWLDGNYGARYVARFNRVTGNTYIEVHSVQGRNRAVQWWEFYGNTQTKASANWYPFAFVRGGSGMIWGNRVSSTYTNDILIDNVRSQGDPGDGVGACNGSSNWDQNIAGMQGYACRDQLGRSKDNVTWTTGGAFTQDLTPAYFWDNLKGTSPLTVVINDACGYSNCIYRNSLHLVQNRDWYRQPTTFDGTTGVGVGTLSSRPSTCVPGVAYWATDQGEWNSRKAGPDGQLYRCVAANSWSLHYVPFTYPHPLQNDGAPAPVLQPPSGVTALVR